MISLIIVLVAFLGIFLLGFKKGVWNTCSGQLSE